MIHNKNFQGFKMFLLKHIIHFLISEGKEKIFLTIGIFSVAIISAGNILFCEKGSSSLTSALSFFNLIAVSHTFCHWGASHFILLLKS